MGWTSGQVIEPWSDLSFFEKRWSSLRFILVAIAILALSFVYGLAVEVSLDINPLGRVRSRVLADGVAEKYIHRCYLAALIVLIVTGVVLVALALASVTVIVCG